LVTDLVAHSVTENRQESSRDGIGNAKFLSVSFDATFSFRKKKLTKRNKRNFSFLFLRGMEKPQQGQVYHSPGQMKFGFINQCQVSKSPEIQAIAKNFTMANRAFSAI